jgi:hypothetical protein
MTCFRATRVPLAQLQGRRWRSQSTYKRSTDQQSVVLRRKKPKSVGNRGQVGRRASRRPLALAAFNSAAPTRCRFCLATPTNRAASAAMRFVPTTMNAPIASFSGVKPSGRRGDGGRSAGAERAARCDDFDVHDEPCCARRRATAQGASRAATMNRVRPMPASSARHRARDHGSRDDRGAVLRPMHASIRPNGLKIRN